eukprot:2815180-Pleurochrysis_carterae.AAC.6
MSHLDTVLEHADWEGGRGRRREPEAEVGVRRVGSDLLADLLERWHPAGGEVAVLQHHPAAGRQCFLDEPVRDGALALPKRDGLRALAAAAARVGKLEQLQHRVLAGREDEDERCHARRVLVAALEVKRRRLHERLAQLSPDKVTHRRHHLVRSEAAQHTQPIKRRDSLLPLARQRLRVRLSMLVDGEPALSEAALVARRHRVGQPGEMLVLAQLDELLPCLVAQPARVHLANGRRAALEAAATGQEELPLLLQQLALALQDLDAHEQRQEELVLLVERAADVTVDGKRVLRHQVGQTLLEHLARRRLVDRATKERDVPAQAQESGRDVAGEVARAHTSTRAMR